MQTISAKAAINTVKLLFIARLFLFYFYYYNIRININKVCKNTAFIDTTSGKKEINFWRIPTGCK